MGKRGPLLTEAVDLVHALDNDGLFIDFQPVIDLNKGRVVAVEALVRWRHPSRGVIAPDDFLPIAEAAGLRAAVTLEVLAKAIDGWATTSRPLELAINVWPSDLTNDTVLSAVLDRLMAHSERLILTLEITERGLATGDPRIAEATRDLARRGVRISLDDFGTGDSALWRLRDLHVDEVKIDRSFVAGMCSGPADRAVVRFAVDLAHSLGLTVVAEGVDREEHVDRLLDMGVERIQGFLFGRPAGIERAADANAIPIGARAHH